MEQENTVVIPELALKTILDGLLANISKNLKEVPKEETMLFRIFGSQAYNKFKYYEQGVALFTQTNRKSRQIKTKVAFDGDLSSYPTIYITIGKDDYAFSGIGDQDGGYVNDKDKRSTPMKRCRFRGESSIVLVTDSVEEMAIMYHVIRAMLISSGDTFGYWGLENVKVGGADVQLNEDTIPKAVYMRAISLVYEYDILIPSMIHYLSAGTSLTSTGKAIDTITSKTNI